MMTLLKRRRAFRRLWLGEVVSHVGDWLAYIAVAVVALQLGDGLLAVAMVFVAHTLPHAILAPLAGAVSDRFDRRTILVLTSALQGVVTLGMTVAVFGGHLWTLQGLLVARVSLGALFLPAQSAAVPRLVAPDEIEAANVLSATTWSVVFALGVAAGGLVSALVGPTLAIALDALTYFAAATILSGLPALPPRPATTQRPGLPRLGDAWARVKRDRALLEAVLGKTPLAFAGGGAWVLLNHVSGESVVAAGSAALMLGLIHAVRGIGTGVGPLIVQRVRRRSEKLAWIGATWATFAGIAGFALSSEPAWLLAFAGVWGMGSGANWVVTGARRQRLTPDAYQGRAASIDVLCMTVAQSAAAVLGAVVAGWLGDPAMAAWVGLALGVLSWAALQAHVQRRLTIPLRAGTLPA